jgi:hypothetical protein
MGQWRWRSSSAVEQPWGAGMESVVADELDYQFFYYS